ncbi:hypothetical protein HPB51_001377 [Rhipicephalus microplus]|uniref:Uncharacterized protein n=1 Tax=Rhipicephalus microplus TaxID=6941 RepID=A0A9J6EQA5_RHIMP|nr:hypothetical protein HPB51_001377 [Rhipicephalus microplus]
MFDQVWLNEDDIDALFPGLGLHRPCTAEVHRNSSSTSYCHIIERLCFWNCVLWQAGFQLRELTAPGELSLVRVARDGGRRQVQHGRDVRLLFHVLLECHRCVVGVELDDVLVEGSGLREFRVSVSSAFRDNAGLRSLKRVSLFSDYSSLEKLKLSGFLLDYSCVCLLSSLAAKQGGSLKHLDISSCRWVLEGSKRSLDAPTDDVQPFEQYCAGLEPLDKRENVRLSHLSIIVKGLKLHDFKTLLFLATALESLRTTLICDVPLDELPEICRAVRQAEISDMVHITDEYLVDPVALSKLEHFREAVSHVVVSCLRETNASAFCKTVHLVRSWNHVTTFRLTISKEAMRDVFMMWSLCCYVNEANTLKELELSGCNEQDLSTCLGEVIVNHSLLLQVIFSNSSLRTLRLSQIRLSEVNLNFMVDAVYCNDTLTELDFSSSDLSENDGLLRLLAIDFDINETLLRLRVSNTSCNDTKNEGWAAIEAFLSRNVGFVTCASHYVVQFVDDNRCTEALAFIRRSRALIDKV